MFWYVIVSDLFLLGFYCFKWCCVSSSYIKSAEYQEEDDDLNEYDVSLDVSKRTPLTRSNAMGVEPGSTQTVGGEAPGAYKKVPTYDNECMLWSIVNIAINKGNGKVKVVRSDGKEETKEICKSYTAEKYYDYVKNRALGQSYLVTDDFGNDNEKIYNGGSMTSSLGAKVAKQVGVMEGKVLRFNSYEELYNCLSSTTWKQEHPDGTYVISNTTKGHASVCNGVSKKGSVRLVKNYDSSVWQDSRYTSENNANDHYEIIY